MIDFVRGFIVGYGLLLLLPYLVLGFVLWHVYESVEVLPSNVQSLATLVIGYVIAPLALGLLQWVKVKVSGAGSQLFWAYYGLLMLQSFMIGMIALLYAVGWLRWKTNGEMGEVFAEYSEVLSSQLFGGSGPTRSLILIVTIAFAYALVPALMKRFGHRVQRGA